MVDILIREAQTEDIPTIEDIIEAGYRGEQAKAGWTFESDLLDGKRLNNGEIQTALTDENSCTFIAIDSAGKIIGTICVSRQNDWFEFGKFAVQPNLQGQGIGKALINYAIKFAKDNWGAKSMGLCVLSRRVELVDYYRRIGFVDNGKRLDFIAMHPYVTLKEGVDNLELMLMEMKI
jgi:predicted N-acetyltransferase YhbS